MTLRYDAVVVGSGPNGLAAAITLTRRGARVLLVEGSGEIGGGMRTRELTLPGFRHDVCSAVHPLAVASPFFKELSLADHGLRWIHSPAAVAHPLADFSAPLLKRSVDATAEGLGVDADAYRRLMQPLVDRGEELLDETLQPILHIPQHPLILARFGLKALRSAQSLAQNKFRGPQARALFAGLAAHSMISLERPGSAAVALMLAMVGHLYGWPIPEGGASSIAQAMASYFKSLGGEIRTNCWVQNLSELPPSRWIFLDVGPAQLAELAGDRLSVSQRDRLARYRYGMGIYKMDFALSAPVPWSDRNCRESATVHLGGTLDEIVSSENASAEGRHSSRPFVLAAQPSLFDAQRAASGQHTLWAYCHAPSRSENDCSAAIEAQIERYAPGFSKLILGRSAWTAMDFERYNPNYRGGDISAGEMSLRQTLFRPALSLNPYRTPLKGVYLCSASTPPGPGVHGMCGHLAAISAMGSVGLGNSS